MQVHHRVAVIGAGPSGLAAARALSKRGIPFDGFEAASCVGGLWNIRNPRSTVYESAHLISSRTTTEFAEFPMPPGTPDYPSHRDLARYFVAYAGHFDLTRHYEFNSTVERVEPIAGAAPGSPRWRLTWTGPEGTHQGDYEHVVLANGTLATPSVPSFEGEFTGELRHTSEYRSPDDFVGRRVLVIGAGNSGCDIAVDAVHRAASVDLSVRRGYYFVPKYIAGRPSDTLVRGRPLPRPIKQALDAFMLRIVGADATKLGFPKPDYRIYESHPVVNTLVLHHAGQGDIGIRPDIERFDGRTVHFVDGTTTDYDLVMLATGYRLDYPFVDREHLAWTGASPRLYLNIFPPSFNGLAVLGMVEASGIGWQGRFEQAELLAEYLAAPDGARAAFERGAAGRWPDLTGGYRYLALDRMSYYVNNHAYRREVARQRARLSRGARAGTAAGERA